MNKLRDVIGFYNVLKKASENQNGAKTCPVCNNLYKGDQCKKCGNAPMV